jgi:DNA-binding MarR family transcriptional regulator
MSMGAHAGGAGGVDGYQPAWNMSTTLTYIARTLLLPILSAPTSFAPTFVSSPALRAATGPGPHVTSPALRERKDAAEPAAACSSDDLIELLFFAYRDFVGDPDRILAEYGFGRAHHRVLHFVDRYPGLTIAELLDILRITKQSLNRVLKDLIGQGYIAQRPGTQDRRQRLLTCTPSGAALAADLTRVQARRLARALASPEDAAAPESFLMAMIEPDERAVVRRLMARRGGGAA